MSLLVGHASLQKFGLKALGIIDEKMPRKMKKVQFCLGGNKLIKNVYVSAISSTASYRPELPPCPAFMLVCRRIGESDVFICRSFATHLAGSQ